eukprot:PhM_4_TR14680/c0_g1_i1/m.16583
MDSLVDVGQSEDDVFAAVQLQSRWRAKRAQMDFKMVQAQGLNPGAVDFLRKKKNAMRMSVRETDPVIEASRVGGRSAPALMRSVDKEQLSLALSRSFTLLKPDMAMFVMGIMFTCASVCMLFFIPQFLLLGMRLIFYNDDGQITLEEFTIQLTFFALVLTAATVVAQCIWKVLMERWGGRVEGILINTSAHNAKLIRKEEVDETRERHLTDTKRIIFSSLPKVASSICAICMGLGMIFWQTWILGLLVFGFCGIIYVIGSSYDRFVHNQSVEARYLRDQEEERWCFLHSEHSQSAMNDVIAINKFKRDYTVRSSAVHLFVGGLYRLAFFLAPVFYLYAGGMIVRDRVIETHQVVFCIFYFGYCLVATGVLNSCLVDLLMNFPAIARVMVMLPDDERDIEDIIFKNSEVKPIEKEKLNKSLYAAVDGDNMSGRDYAFIGIMSLFVLAGTIALIAFAAVNLKESIVEVNELPSIDATQTSTASSSAATQDHLAKLESKHRRMETLSASAHQRKLCEQALDDSTAKFAEMSPEEHHKLRQRSKRPVYTPAKHAHVQKRFQALQHTVQASSHVPRMVMCLNVAEITDGTSCTRPLHSLVEGSKPVINFRVMKDASTPDLTKANRVAVAQLEVEDVPSATCMEDLPSLLDSVQCSPIDALGRASCANLTQSIRCPGRYGIRLRLDDPTAPLENSTLEEYTVLVVDTYVLPKPLITPQPMPKFVGRNEIKVSCPVPAGLRDCALSYRYTLTNAAGQVVDASVRRNKHGLSPKAVNAVGKFNFAATCFVDVAGCAVNSVTITQAYVESSSTAYFEVEAAPPALPPPTINGPLSETFAPLTITLSHDDAEASLYYSFSGESGSETGAPTLKGEVLYDSRLGIDVSTFGHTTLWVQAKRPGYSPSAIRRFDMDLKEPSSSDNSQYCPSIKFACKAIDIPGFPEGFSPSVTEKMPQDRTYGTGVSTSKPCGPKGGGPAVMQRCTRIITSQMAPGMVEAVLAGGKPLVVEASWPRWDGATRSKSGRYVAIKVEKAQPSTGSSLLHSTDVNTALLETQPAIELALLNDGCGNFNGADNEVECKERDLCEWNSQFKRCLDKPCELMRTHRQCVGSPLLCAWENSLPGSDAGICRAQQCHEHHDSTRCDAHGCSWDEERKACFNAPCNTKLRKIDCNIPCIWQTEGSVATNPFPTAFSAATNRRLLQSPKPTVSTGTEDQKDSLIAQIEKSAELDPNAGTCLEPTCGFWSSVADVKLRQKMCERSHCIFNHTNNKCMYAACGQQKSADACFQQNCLWMSRPAAQTSIDGLVEHHCVHRSCKDMNLHPDDCVASNCHYNFQDGTCSAPPIESHGALECDAWGQEWIASEQKCKPRPCMWDEQSSVTVGPRENYETCRASAALPTVLDCTSMKSEESCKSLYDGGKTLCEWKFGMCHFKSCDNYFSRTSCQRIKNCNWVHNRAPHHLNKTVPPQGAACRTITLSAVPTETEMLSCTALAGCVVTAVPGSELKYMCTMAPTPTFASAETSRCLAASPPCPSPCIQNPEKIGQCMLAPTNEISVSELSNSDSVGTCVPSACSGRQKDACYDQANSHCTWNGDNNACEPAPCSHYYDESRCNAVYKFAPACHFRNVAGKTHGVCEPLSCDQRNQNECTTVNRGTCIWAPPAETSGMIVRPPSTCRVAECSEMKVRSSCSQNKNCVWNEQWEGTTMVAASCQRIPCNIVMDEATCGDRKDCSWMPQGICAPTPCSSSSVDDCTRLPYCEIHVFADTAGVDPSRTTTVKDTIIGTNAPSYAPSAQGASRRNLQQTNSQAPLQAGQNLQTGIVASSQGVAPNVAVCRRKACDGFADATVCLREGCMTETIYDVAVGSDAKAAPKTRCVESCSRLKSDKDCQSFGEACRWDNMLTQCVRLTCADRTSLEQCTKAPSCQWNNNTKMCFSNQAQALSRDRHRTGLFRTLAAKDAHQKAQRTHGAAHHPVYQHHHEHNKHHSLESDDYAPSGLPSPVRREHDVPHNYAEHGRPHVPRQAHPHERRRVPSKQHHHANNRVTTFRTLEAVQASNGVNPAMLLHTTESEKEAVRDATRDPAKLMDEADVKQGTSYKGRCDVIRDDVQKRVAMGECNIDQLVSASREKCDLSMIPDFRVDKSDLSNGALPDDYYFTRCMKNVQVPAQEEFAYMSRGRGIITVVSSDSVQKAFENLQTVGGAGNLKSMLKVDNSGAAQLMSNMFTTSPMEKPPLEEHAGDSTNEYVPKTKDAQPNVNVEIKTLEQNMNDPSLDADFEAMKACNGDTTCMQPHIIKITQFAQKKSQDSPRADPLDSIHSGNVESTAPTRESEQPKMGRAGATTGKEKFPSQEKVHRCMLDNSDAYPDYVYPGSVVLAPLNVDKAESSPVVFARALVVGRETSPSGERLIRVNYLAPANRMSAEANARLRQQTPNQRTVGNGLATSAALATTRRDGAPADAGTPEQQMRNTDSVLNQASAALFTTPSRAFPSGQLIPMLPVGTPAQGLAGEAPPAQSDITDESTPIPPMDLTIRYRRRDCIPDGKLFETRLVGVSPTTYNGPQATDDVPAFTASVQFMSGECEVHKSSQFSTDATSAPEVLGAPQDEVLVNLDMMRIEHRMSFGLDARAYVVVKKCSGIKHANGAPEPSTEEVKPYDGAVDALISAPTYAPETNAPTAPAGSDAPTSSPSNTPVATSARRFRVLQTTQQPGSTMPTSTTPQTMASSLDQQREALGESWIPRTRPPETFNPSEYATATMAPGASDNTGATPRPARGAEPSGSASDPATKFGSVPPRPVELACQSSARPEWVVAMTGNDTAIPFSSLLHCQIAKKDLPEPDVMPLMAVWHRGEEAVLRMFQPKILGNGQKVFPILRFSSNRSQMIDSGLFMTEQELQLERSDDETHVVFRFRVPSKALGLDAIAVRIGQSPAVLSRVFTLVHPEVRVEDVAYHWHNRSEFRIDFDNDLSRGIQFPFKLRDPVWVFFTEQPDANRPPQTPGTGPKGVGASGSRYFVADASLPPEMRRGGGGRLYTPLMKIPEEATTETMLGFAYYYFGNPKDMPTIRVLVSTSLGFEWTVLVPEWPPAKWTELPQSDKDKIVQDRWRFQEVPVTKYQGKTVMFAFEVRWKVEKSNAADGGGVNYIQNQGDFAIDDIVIRRREPDMHVSLNEPLKERFADAPNQRPKCTSSEDSERVPVVLPGAWSNAHGVGVSTLQALEMEPPTGFGVPLPLPPINDWLFDVDKVLVVDSVECPKTTNWVESPLMKLDEGVDMQLKLLTLQSGGPVRYEVSTDAANEVMQMPKYDTRDNTVFNVEVNDGKDGWKAIAGLKPWSGQPFAWATKVIDLSPFRGMTVRFRVVVQAGAGQTFPSLIAMPEVGIRTTETSLNLNEPPAMPSEPCTVTSPCCATHKTELLCSADVGRGCQWRPHPAAVCEWVPPAVSQELPSASSTFIHRCAGCSTDTVSRQVSVEAFQSGQLTIEVKLKGTKFVQANLNDHRALVLDHIVGMDMMGFGWEDQIHKADLVRQQLLQGITILDSTTMRIPVPSVASFQLGAGFAEDSLMVTIPAVLVENKNDVASTNVISYFAPSSTRRDGAPSMIVRPDHVEASRLQLPEAAVVPGTEVPRVDIHVTLTTGTVNRVDPVDVLRPENFIVTCPASSPCRSGANDAGLAPRSRFHERFADLFKNRENGLRFEEAAPDAIVYPGMEGGVPEGIPGIVTGAPKQPTEAPVPFSGAPGGTLPPTARIVAFTISMDAISDFALDHDETVCLKYQTFSAEQVCFTLSRDRPARPHMTPDPRSVANTMFYDHIDVEVMMPQNIPQEKFDMVVEVYRIDRALYPNPARYVIHTAVGHVPVSSMEREVRARIVPKSTTATSYVESESTVAFFSIIPRVATRVNAGNDTQSCFSGAECPVFIEGVWSGQGSSLQNFDVAFAMLPAEDIKTDSDHELGRVPPPKPSACAAIARNRKAPHGKKVSESVVPERPPSATMAFYAERPGTYAVCFQPKHLMMASSAEGPFFEIGRVDIMRAVPSETPIPNKN